MTMPNATVKLCFLYSPYILLWIFFLILQALLLSLRGEESRHSNIPVAAAASKEPSSSVHVNANALRRRDRVLRKRNDTETAGSKKNRSPLAAAAATTTKTPLPPGDALFNSVDVYHQEGSLPPSKFRCVGRSDSDVLDANYSWMFTSCHFQNLCLDTQTKEFLMITDDEDEQQPAPPPLAMGSINPRWSGRGYNKGFHKVKWIPKQVTTSQISNGNSNGNSNNNNGYYQLPDDAVLVPFHSMAAHNVGHLLWDDFYPLFTLLKLFGFITGSNSDSDSTTKFNVQHQLLLLRWIPTTPPLYATCEMQKKKSRFCNENFQRFLPLLGVDPKTFFTTKNMHLQQQQSTRGSGTLPLKSSIVCARNAVAGIGMLSDHGLRDHGWLPGDPQAPPHNIGRGDVFRDFSAFMVQNILPHYAPMIPTNARRKITFSTHSSKGFARDTGFENQTAAVQRALLAESDNPPEIQSLTMRDLTVEQQVQVALESAIFITVSGGGAVTATFLPPGSTLIVYYLEDGGFDYWNTSYTYTPARLDWDLLNNAGHLRVHWLPMKTMNERGDLQVLEQLVLHELESKGLLDGG